MPSLQRVHILWLRQFKIFSVLWPLEEVIESFRFVKMKRRRNDREKVTLELNKYYLQASAELDWRKNIKKLHPLKHWQSLPSLWTTRIYMEMLRGL